MASSQVSRARHPSIPSNLNLTLLPPSVGRAPLLVAAIIAGR